MRLVQSVHLLVIHDLAANENHRQIEHHWLVDIGSQIKLLVQDGIGDEVLIMYASLV